MAWPTTVLNLLVEIYVSGVWVDITSYVRRRDGQGITITDGTQGTQQRRASPSQLTLELNNRDGRFSPRNLTSPYVGQLTINTEIRVSAEGFELFWGEVASGWPTKWTSGAPDSGDAWVPLRAGGRSERINADTTALRDALWTQALSNPLYYPTYYWPLTDPPAAPSAVTGIDEDAAYTGVNLVTFGSHSPTFSTVSGPKGSSSTPDFSSQGSLTGILTSPNLGDFEIVLWFKLQDGDSSNFDTMSLYQISLDDNPTGFDCVLFAGLGTGAAGIDAANFSTGGFTGRPQTAGTRNSDLTLNVNSTPCTQGDWHELRVTYTESGGAITTSLYLDGSLRGTDTSAASGYSLGALERISFNANTSMGIYSAPYTTATGLGLSSIGSVGIYHGTPADPGTYPAGLGWAGEAAGDRLVRLCDENDIALTITDPGSTSTMTAQRTGSTLASLLEDCARTDGGLLTDSTDQLGLRYVTRAQLYPSATTPLLELDYTLRAEVMPGLDTDESAHTVANDVTATSEVGWARSQQLTGPRNVTEPSAGTGGIGRYPGRLSTDLDTQQQLQDAADWTVWTETADVPRFTSIPVNLFALAAAGKTSLWHAAAALLPGDAISMVNTPIWIPDDIAVFCVGRSITVANYEWTIDYNTTDATAWQHIGGPLEDTTYGRLDSADSYLHLGVSSGATTLLVANTGMEPVPTLWTHADGDYKVQIDDEIMTVTAVSTVTKSLIATGTAAYADNASVTPGLPGGATAAGHLMVLVAAARSSGTVAACPSGWFEIDGLFENELLALRVHTGSESAPTVTFSGGAAGDTHGAVIASFAGLQARQPIVLDSVEVVMANSATNTGTSQNIDVAALPAIRDNCAVMQVGVKQDDWTSVAALAGATEVYDGSSTLGSDMGIVWDWRSQSTRTAVAAQTFIVTGGTSVNWDSGIFAIDGNVQSLTVTRAQDGTTAAAHAAGAQMRLAYPLRLGR